MPDITELTVTGRSVHWQISSAGAVIGDVDTTYGGTGGDYDPRLAKNMQKLAYINDTSAGTHKWYFSLTIAPTWHELDVNIASILTASLWAAKGDLLVGTANDAAAILTVGSDGKILFTDSGEPTGLKYGDVTVTVNKILTAGYSGEISTGDIGIRLEVLETLTIVNSQISLGTAPTGANGIFDWHKDGTTIYTTQGNRPTITAGSNESNTAVPDVTSLVAGDILTLEADQVGSTVAGSNLVAQLLCTAAYTGSVA